MSIPESRSRNAGGHHRERLRVRDFLGRKHVGFDSPDDNLSMEDTLIEGEFLHQELRTGLLLHVSNVREEHAFTATSHISEGLSCIFFLDGEVDIKVGDRRFEFRAGRRGLTEGTAIMSARPESFERRSRTAQHLRHLVVSVTPAWLNLEGLRETSGGGRVTRLFADHLNGRRWTLTPRVVELVHQLVTPSAFLPELRNLYLEGRAVEIVGETLAAVTGDEPRATEGLVFSRRDMARLQRARDFVLANVTASLSVETIAREAGINASGLQRLFRLAEGMSIFEYVRKLRLERAYAALRSGEANVHDASLIAGYSSPANFATAFRRQFGIAPSEASGNRSGSLPGRHGPVT